MTQSKRRPSWMPPQEHKFRIGDVIAMKGWDRSQANCGVVTGLYENSNGPYVKYSFGPDESDIHHVYERELELIYRREAMDAGVEEYEFAIAAQEAMK
jgi:hypothetical protein